jgi:hypothetical protein
MFLDYSRESLMKKLAVLVLLIFLLPSLCFSQKLDISKADTARVIKSPRGAMLRSLAVPGWGQLYNGKIIKAVGFAAAESFIMYMYLKNHNEMKKAEFAYKREEFMDQRNAFGWYMALAVILSITDAYVDAYLVNFDKDMKISINIDNKGVFFNLAKSF